MNRKKNAHSSVSGQKVNTYNIFRKFMTLINSYCRTNEFGFLQKYHLSSVKKKKTCGRFSLKAEKVISKVTSITRVFCIL